MLKRFFLLLSLLMFSQNLLANEEDDLKSNFFNKLEQIKMVVQANAEDKEKRYNEIINILTPVFDFELMAKLSLGKAQWRNLSKNDRVKFVSIYTLRMKNSYSAKLDSYNDEKIKIYSVQRKKSRILLKTSIQSNDNALDVNYKFYKPKKPKEGKESWLIYDVVILGVSILKADKAQFKDYLQTKSINQLMENLANQ